MARYFIDGQAAQGEDYAEAIEALPSEPVDGPAEVCIETPDNRTLMVCNWPGGRFLVINQIAGGGEWRASALSKEQAKAIVVSFLDGDEWRKGPQWEWRGPPTKDDQRRMLVLLLAAALFFGLNLWRSASFDNSGSGGWMVDTTPPPPRQVVRPKDLAGTWYYRGAAPGTICEITFNADSTYSLAHRRPDAASTNAGRWGLLPDSLVLYPFYTSSASGKGAINRCEPVKWLVIGASSNVVVPFGGDSLNPGRWTALSRTRAALPPETAAVGAASVWLGATTALTVILCVSVAVLRSKARTKPRALKQERTSASNVASAVLPQIESLRGGYLSGGPVPSHQTTAHKQLVARARRFVAQLAYFQRPENPPAVEGSKDDPN